MLNTGYHWQGGKETEAKGSTPLSSLQVPKSASTNLLIPSQDPFSAELGVFPRWSPHSPFAWQCPPARREGEPGRCSPAGGEQQGEKVLSCPSTLLLQPAPPLRLPPYPQHPQGELLRKRRWWGGDGPSLELRGWDHFHAEGQIDFSSAVSALMHSLVLSSITPKTSRSYSPEGRKQWVVLAGPRALT